jgi:hypothetical protein
MNRRADHHGSDAGDSTPRPAPHAAFTPTSVARHFFTDKRPARYLTVLLCSSVNDVRRRYVSSSSADQELSVDTVQRIESRGCCLTITCEDTSRLRSEESCSWIP